MSGEEKFEENCGNCKHPLTVHIEGNCRYMTKDSKENFVIMGGHHGTIEVCNCTKLIKVLRKT